MVSKGQFVGLDWNRITRLHSQVMIGTQEVKNSLTASRCHLKPVQEGGRRVVGSNPIWDSDIMFFYKSYDYFSLRARHFTVFETLSHTLHKWIIN